MLTSIHWSHEAFRNHQMTLSQGHGQHYRHVHEWLALLGLLKEPRQWTIINLFHASVLHNANVRILPALPKTQRARKHNQSARTSQEKVKLSLVTTCKLLRYLKNTYAYFRIQGQ